MDGYRSGWASMRRAFRFANAHRDEAAVKMGHPGVLHTHVSEARHGAPGR